MQACTIKLSGSLARKFGREHIRHLDTGTTKEAISAVVNTLPGLRQHLLESSKKGLTYAVVRNRENVGEDAFKIRGTRELRIVPVIQGSKKAGTLQTIIGAVLIVAGAVLSGTGYAAIGEPMVKVGIAMVAGGVIQMLSPTTKGLSSTSESSARSYAFGSAKNTTAAGYPVPVCYGERQFGGAILSAGIYAEDAS